jgi:hypothetical protein
MYEIIVESPKHSSQPEEMLHLMLAHATGGRNVFDEGLVSFRWTVLGNRH